MIVRLQDVKILQPFCGDKTSCFQYKRNKNAKNQHKTIKDGGKNEFSSKENNKELCKKRSSAAYVYDIAGNAVCQQASLCKELKHKHG